MLAILYKNNYSFHGYKYHTARTKYQRKLKEGLYIDWEKPELNRQIKHISSTLAV